MQALAAQQACKGLSQGLAFQMFLTWRYGRQDAAADYQYGRECLFRFFSYGLEEHFDAGLYRDFEQETLLVPCPPCKSGPIGLACLFRGMGGTAYFALVGVTGEEACFDGCFRGWSTGLTLLEPANRV